MGAIKPAGQPPFLSPSLPFREERAGERRFSKICRKLPLSPALSPLVPLPVRGTETGRKERENSISAADRHFFRTPYLPSISIMNPTQKGSDSQ